MNRRPAGLQAHPEQRFDDEPVHPPGRARVPAPSAAAGVRRRARRRRRRSRTARPCRSPCASGVAARFTGLIMVASSQAAPGPPAPRRPSPPRSRRACTGRRSRARPGRSRGCSRGPAGRLVEGRVEQLDVSPRHAAHEALVDRIHRHARALASPAPRAPTSFARRSRSGTRRCPPIPAACRRRSTRAGTTRRPSRAVEVAAQLLASASRSRAAKSVSPFPRDSAANCFSTAQRKKPSQTLSPAPSIPTRFMPSFQSPEPISGRPCAPSAGRARSRARSARRRWRGSADWRGTS